MELSQRLRRITSRFSLREVLLRWQVLLVLSFIPNVIAQIQPVPYPLQNSDPTKTYTVGGNVINAITGEPLNRALVNVAGRSVMTGSDGSFEFDGLPPGQIFVAARKPGFFAENELHPGRQPQMLTVPAVNGPTVIKLVPQAVITGRITDSNGDPLEDVPVKLVSSTVQEGRRIWMRNHQTNTNEDGEFRIAELRPGRYFLSAGPSLRNSEFQNPQTGQMIKGYAKAYYAGAPDQAEATPISLSQGQHAVVDLSLETVPLYQVSVMIAGVPPNAGTSMLVLDRDGDDAASIWNSLSPNAFRLTLPRGVFKIRSVWQTSPTQFLRGQTTANVATDLDNVVVALEPAAVIPLQVRVESTKPEERDAGNVRPNVYVRLISQDPFGNDQFPQVEDPANPVPVFRNIEPGRYTVQVENSYPGYVRSIRCGTADLYREPLTVGSGQALPPIEVVLRDDAATLAVTVRSDNPVRGGMVILAGTGDLQNVIKTSFAGSGVTEIGGLAPGDYSVYAFDDVSDLEYRNTEVLNSYSSHAARITLSPNAKTNVIVDLIRRED